MPSLTSSGVQVSSSLRCCPLWDPAVSRKYALECPSCDSMVIDDRSEITCPKAGRASAFG